MNLTYGSVCSGIEAASVAWEPLGWRPKFFAEIEKFPAAVLAHHYGSNMPGEPLSRNGVPNHGDFTKIGPDAGPIDLLVGGTPCQSFSVAGKRLGLDDPRGNLALEYLALARRLKPQWIVWENVPGAFSSRSGAGKAGTGDADGHDDGGIPATSDFAAFLTFVRECGYGFAYRVLDAQYVRVSGYERAFPQRRRRIFLVGYLGDWRPAAAVLFEPEGVPGHPEPRRAARQGDAQGFMGSLQSGGEAGGRVVSPAVSAKWAKGLGGPAGDETQNMIACAVADTLGTGANQTTGFAGEAVAKPLGAKKDGGYRADLDNDTYIAVAHTLRGEGFDASEDGSGRGTPAVAVPSPLDDGVQWEVRRLTPRECERLQGFADDRTAIPWRGKPAEECPDGPRYRAVGNSMAVNVMRWIGERIALFEKLKNEGLIP